MIRDIPGLIWCTGVCFSRTGTDVVVHLWALDAAGVCADDLPALAARLLAMHEPWYVYVSLPTSSNNRSQTWTLTYPYLTCIISVVNHLVELIYCIGTRINKSMCLKALVPGSGRSVARQDALCLPVAAMTMARLASPTRSSISSTIAGYWPSWYWSWGPRTPPNGSSRPGREGGLSRISKACVGIYKRITERVSKSGRDAKGAYNWIWTFWIHKSKRRLIVLNSVIQLPLNVKISNIWNIMNNEQNYLCQNDVDHRFITRFFRFCCYLI